jgi:hypothetical protein
LFAIGIVLMTSTPQLSPPQRPHFVAAGELQLAVMEGRLADARDLARAIETEPAANDSPYLAELRVAAQAIERSTDLEAAGAQLGRLARACGSCHEAAGATLRFTFVPAPEARATPAAQMRRHAWAATRLWEGVAGPADASWNAGTAVLASTPFDVAATVHEKPNVEVFERAETLREQARVAGSVARDDRAALYGEMMVGCAGCHAIARPHPSSRTRED